MWTWKYAASAFAHAASLAAAAPALAGPARVRELRRRARRMGLDPNQWFGNVERAALHVTGEETVGYVANVRPYYLAYRLTSELRTGRD